MRPRNRLAAAAALAAACLAAARADDDPAKEARLLIIDGKFREADSVLSQAPESVRNDPALHDALADLALKWTRGKDGEDKRNGLRCARDHYSHAIDAKPDDAVAA